MIEETLNNFLTRRYSDDYNCSHFARDVWKELTGHDFSDLLVSWNCGHLREAMESRKHLKKLERQTPLCLVLFQNPKEAPHLAVCIRGKVLHMTADGPRYEPLYNVSLLYRSHKFYLI